MKKLIIVLTILFVSAWCFAGEPKKESANYAEIGAHGSSVTKDGTRAAEYDEAITHAEGSLKFRWVKTDGDVKIKWEGKVESHSDMNFKLVINSGTWFKSTTTYNKFFHRLGHDKLANLEGRESVDPENNTPGGKFVFHDDYDPDVEYYTVYEKFSQVFDFNIDNDSPFKHVQVGLSALSRKGYHQINGLSHCDTCHITSKAAKTDELTYDLWVKADAKVGNTDISYKGTYSKFNNQAPVYDLYFDLPRHPVTGGLIDEFAGRTLFGGERLPTNYNNDNEMFENAVSIESVISPKDTIYAKLLYSTQKNKAIDLQMDTKAGSFRYTRKFSKNFRFDAYFSYYTIDNDDYFVDLPNWRVDGDPMAFNRLSAFNRDVSYFKLRGIYKFSNNQRLTLTYRYQQIDRDNVIVNYEDNSTETTKNLFKVRYDGKFDGAKAFVEVSYEDIDHPFENYDGIYEESYHNYSGGTLWYYLRERVGEATSLPNQDFRIKGSFTVDLTGDSSLNIYANYRDGENDELNTYKMDLKSKNAGFDYFVQLNDSTVVTIGYDYSNGSQTTLYAVPIMDG